MNRLGAAWLAVVLLAGCSGGGSTTQPTVSTVGAAGAQTATVTMTDRLAFDPKVVLARVGTVLLMVKNVGTVPHDLVFDATALGKVGPVVGGQSVPLRLVFSRAGSYGFVCTFHTGMAGKVVVS